MMSSMSSHSSSSPHRMGLVLGYLLACIFLIGLVVILILYIKKSKNPSGSCKDCQGAGATCDDNGCTGNPTSCENCADSSGNVHCDQGANTCSVVTEKCGSFCPNNCESCAPTFNASDMSTWVTCEKDSASCKSTIEIMKNKKCHKFAGMQSGFSPNSGSGNTAFLANAGDMLNQGVKCLAKPNTPQCQSINYPCDNGTCLNDSSKCTSDADCGTTRSPYADILDQPDKLPCGVDSQGNPSCVGVGYQTDEGGFKTSICYNEADSSTGSVFDYAEPKEMSFVLTSSQMSK